MCSPNACKGVFNSNVPIFNSNFADGLHFSVFFIRFRVNIVIIEVVVEELGVIPSSCSWVNEDAQCSNTYESYTISLVHLKRLHLL